MRRSNIVVFNEYVPKNTVSSAPVYTSTEMLSRLGHYDTLAVQAVIDNVTVTSGGFEMYLEHSADGRNFLTVGSAIINFATLSTTAVNVQYGTNDSTKPLLGYVRFRMYFDDANTAAHVKVLVTQRDEGG